MTDTACRSIVTHDGEDAAMNHEDSGSDDREYQCLIRATNGKEINFSTQVKAYLRSSIDLSQIYLCFYFVLPG